MALVASLPTFVLTVLLISATPGPAMALILRRAALRGFRATVPTVLGLEAGLYAWALAAAAGLAALVAASEAAFLVLRIAGAGVLVALGLRSLRSAFAREHRDGAEPLSRTLEPLSRGEWWRAFGEGATVQLANPKLAIFLLAFYPQFVGDGSPLLATTAALALLQVAIETALYLALAAGVGWAGAWFSRTVVRRRLELASGGVLIALGLRVATAGR